MPIARTLQSRYNGKKKYEIFGKDLYYGHYL